MSNKKIGRKNKKDGFTIIEVLVVTFILILTIVALSYIIKGLTISSTRIERMQTVRSQVQEASHYLTKELRMSEFVECEFVECDENSNSITFNWRKEDESSPDGYYKIEGITLGQETIESFFSETWAEIKNFSFLASGTINAEGERGRGNEVAANNRIILRFNVKVDTGATNDEEVFIPVQIMVSLRSYNLKDPTEE